MSNRKCALSLSQLALIISSLSLALPAQALQVVDGTTRDIDVSTPRDEFRVVNAGTLNAQAAVTQSISVQGASTLNLVGTQVSANRFFGLQFSSSQGVIDSSQVTNTAGGGLFVARVTSSTDGSRVTVNNSTIQGSTLGASVSAFSELDILGSRIEGTGVTSSGLSVQGGTARVSNSQVKGGAVGVLVVRENTRPDQPATLVLDGTEVSSLSGPALRVGSGVDAHLTLGNGTTLLGGNGAAMEIGGGSKATIDILASDLVGNIAVQEGSTASFAFAQASLTGNLGVDASSAASVRLDNAHMVGDVLVDHGGSATISLVNASSLSGALANVRQVEIGSGSSWALTRDSQVGDLKLDGGRVTLSEAGAFNRLQVEHLSGNGSFNMRSDFATGNTDFLDITGTSSGNHGLMVASTGTEATVESLRLVQTADGGAQFHLLNQGQKVDMGAYAYALKQDGNDWVLDRETRTVAPITMTAMALFNTPITVAYGELSSLRSRMGELRYSEGRNAGLWMRAYGNQYHVASSGTGTGYQQNQRGMSFGADMQLGDSDWLLGALVGSSRSDLNLDYGSSGKVDSYYVGGYATWLDRETGYYVDTVVKYNRYQNDATVGMSDHSRAKGDYDTHGLSGSVEVGKHIKLSDGYFIEPFAQVASAVVAGKDYSFSNGLRAEGDTAKSLMGKVGATVGKTLPLDGGGMLQPYVKAAYAHEFAQRNEVQVNNNVFNNDLSGSRAELGAGLAWSLTRKFQVHADVEYSSGKHIEQPYGVNLGVRYDF